MILIVLDHAAGAPRRAAFELVTAARSPTARRPAAAWCSAAPTRGPRSPRRSPPSCRTVYRVADPALARRPRARTRASPRSPAPSAREVVLRQPQRPGGRAARGAAPRRRAPRGRHRRARRGGGGRRRAPDLPVARGPTVRAVAEPVVVSVKPGAYPVAGPPAATDGVVASSRGVRGRRFGRPRAPTGAPRRAARVALEEADVVVCGGRGLGDADAFERTPWSAWPTTSGRGVAATRAVVDAGWRPYGEQVGQTGKSVAPKLYVGLATLRRRAAPLGHEPHRA
jgi:electron transfer flavoprotein alpha subunit